MRLLANNEQLALKSVAIWTVCPSLDEHLPDHRFRGADTVAQAGIISRHITPAQQNLAFGGDDMLQGGFAFGTGVQISREKDHADRVVAGGRQFHAEASALGSKKAIGNLQQDTRSVAC